MKLGKKRKERPKSFKGNVVIIIKAKKPTVPK